MYRIEEYSYVSCRRCRSARLDPVPSVDPAVVYDDGYFVRRDDRGGYVDYDHDAELHRVNARRRLKRVTDHVDPGRTPGPLGAIDVGCASGYMLDAYRDAGFGAVGVDVSSWARDRCAERGHVVRATLNEAVTGGVAVVSFFQSLEHLADPHTAVSTAAESLGPGALIVIETWDRESFAARLLGRRWHQVNPPTVLHHFTRDGLRRMLEAERMSVVSIRASSKLVSPELVVGVLSQKSPKTATNLLGLMRRTRLSRVPIPYRAGDLITVVARKQESRGVLATRVAER